MSEILPYHGSNFRALIFKGLQLMDNEKLVPDTKVGDLPTIVEQTFLNGWLDVPPVETFLSRLGQREPDGPSIKKKGRAREPYSCGA